MNNTVERVYMAVYSVGVAFGIFAMHDNFNNDMFILAVIVTIINGLFMINSLINIKTKK